MKNFDKIFNKVAGVGALAGLSLGSPAAAQYVETASGGFRQDKKMELKALEALRTPEDYDIRKTAKIDLTDLEAKKSKDPQALLRIAHSIEIETEDKIQAINTRLYGLSLALQCAIEDKDETKEKELGLLMLQFEKKLKYLKDRKHNNHEDDLDNEQLELSEVPELYLEEITQLIVTIEDVRQELIEIISQSGYLKKLQIEFDCSLEEAKKHQEVRLSNLALTNYYIENSHKINQIFREENPNDVAFADDIGVEAYDAKYDNIIYFNYNLYLYNSSMTRGIIMHELLHKVTRRNLGLSPKAIDLLHQSFVADDKNPEILKVYYSIPTERYVYLKILELELEEKGVRKLNEKFTRKHFNALYELYLNGNLGYQSMDFMNNTIAPKTQEEYDSEKFMDDIYEVYKKLFNEIAEVGDEQQKTYFHPGWDYSQNDNDKA